MDCSKCGARLPLEALFCPACGARVAQRPPAVQARAERKVVSVLFADLVGFTARAEQLDPEDVEAILRPYYAQLREELQRRGGTVEKFIGDAVMAVFGAPVVREDDAIRAVKAALAIRDWAAASGTQLRIGVNTGEALVTLGARPEVGDAMVKGDVVNTAVRLQAAAPVGGVLVGTRTYVLTRDAFVYAPREPVAAKGKSRPIEVWEPLDAGDPLPRAVAPRSPFIGRTRELAVLLEELARARAERRARLVTITGLPGIGKSRLVAELEQRIASGDPQTRWLSGRSVPFGEQAPYGALARIVLVATEIEAGHGSDLAARRLTESVADVIGRPEERRWIEDHLRRLVGLERQEAGRRSARDEAFAAWSRYLRALARQAPVVLVFEDVHLADDGLLDFIEHAVTAITDAPLAMIATARPELADRRPGWSSSDEYRLLPVTPLSHDETRTLIESVADEAPDAAVADEVVSRASGNPLYAEEFARLAPDSREATVPDSVQAIIAARLDTLRPGDKELLQQASVVGDAFWFGALVEVSSRAPEAVADGLALLIERQFVVPVMESSVEGEAEYRFSHDLIREVAYQQLTRPARFERHARTAAWLESRGSIDAFAEALAHHYDSALELGRAAQLPVDQLTDSARAAFERAGERALTLYAFPVAARYFGAAVELTAPDHPLRPLLLLGHGHALSVADTTDRGLAVLAEASRLLAAAGHNLRAAEAEMHMASATWLSGDQSAAERHVRAAAGQAAGSGPSPALARVLTEMARYHGIAERADEAVAAAREAISLARIFDLPAVEAHALDTIGQARYRSGDVEGLADLEQGLELALMADPIEAARAYHQLGWMLWLAGERERAQQLLSASMDLDRRLARHASARWEEALLISLDFISGEWDGFLARADRFRADSEQLGTVYTELLHRAYAAYVYAGRGMDGQASSAARASAEWSRRVGVPQAMVTGLSAFAFVELELGDVDAARKVMHELAAAAPHTMHQFDLVAVAIRADDLGSNQLLRSMFFDPAPPSKWVDAVRLLLDGEFAAAATLLDSIGAKTYAAMARTELAERLARQGRPADAVGEAEAALRFWRAVGADRYIRRLEDLFA